MPQRITEADKSSPIPKSCHRHILFPTIVNHVLNHRFKHSIKTQIWNNSGNIEFSDEPIESFILYFTTGPDTKNTDQYHTHRRMTSYMPENISSTPGRFSN